MSGQAARLAKYYKSYRKTGWSFVQADNMGNLALMQDIERKLASYEQQINKAIDESEAAELFQVPPFWHMLNQMKKLYSRVSSLAYAITDEFCVFMFCFCHLCFGCVRKRNMLFFLLQECGPGDRIWNSCSRRCISIFEAICLRTGSHTIHTIVGRENPSRFIDVSAAAIPACVSRGRIPRAALEPKKKRSAHCPHGDGQTHSKESACVECR